MSKPLSIDRERNPQAGELRTELDELMTECGEPNWDGHGSEAVSRSAQQAAERFIGSLPATVPRPLLAADSDGCVTFEWRTSPRRTLLVSVRQETGLDYSALLGPATAHGSEPFFDEFPEVLSGLVQRVFTK